MKTVLLTHFQVVPLGGAHAIAAWTLQALRETADLTVLAWDAPAVDALNRYYGTALKDGDFRVETVGGAERLIAGAAPGPGFLLRWSLLLRRARELDRLRRFDVLLSTWGEADFGRRGIQYIHTPKALSVAPHRPRFHPIQAGFAAYERVCGRIARASTTRMCTNLTLVNSAYIAAQVRAVYGIPSRVVHPPVAGTFPDLDWSERRNGFICVSRFHPSKQLLEIVAIVEGLRAMGYDLGLTIVGTPHDSAYEMRVRQMAAERGDWLAVQSAIARDDLIELLAHHRYAIHAMAGEHFGIVVAEYLRAGCIPFVHASGGPLAIVGNDDRLTFRDRRQAIERIDRVLRDRELQRSVRDSLAPRREIYSEQRFMEEMRGVVANF